jgi:hypothetical protein
MQLGCPCYTHGQEVMSVSFGSSFVKVRLLVGSFCEPNAVRFRCIAMNVKTLATRCFILFASRQTLNTRNGMAYLTSYVTG